MKQLRRLRKGITLMELVAVIAILGVAMYGLLGLLAEVTVRVRNSEDAAQAMFHAQEVMERAVAQKFSGVVNNSTSRDGYDRYVNVTPVSLNATNVWVIDPASTNYKKVTARVYRAGELKASASEILGNHTHQ